MIHRTNNEYFPKQQETDSIVFEVGAEVLFVNSWNVSVKNLIYRVFQEE